MILSSAKYKNQHSNGFFSLQAAQVLSFFGVEKLLLVPEMLQSLFLVILLFGMQWCGPFLLEVLWLVVLGFVFIEFGIFLVITQFEVLSQDVVGIVNLCVGFFLVIVQFKVLQLVVFRMVQVGMVQVKIVQLGRRLCCGQIYHTLGLFLGLPGTLLDGGGSMLGYRVSSHKFYSLVGQMIGLQQAWQVSFLYMVGM